MQVPAGLGPGAALQLANPMAPGQVLQVVLPAGLKAGDMFVVALPAQAAASVSPAQAAVPMSPAQAAAAALPAQDGPWSTRPCEVEGQLCGQTHPVLAQMQAPMVGVVLSSYAWKKPVQGKHTRGMPWAQDDGFKVPGFAGDLFVPGGTAPGQQIQLMGAPMQGTQGVPTAPCPPADAALLEYEQLLAGATCIVIRDLRTSSRPTKEVAALRLSGSAGELASLYLEVNGDPDAANDGDPFWQFVPTSATAKRYAPAPELSAAAKRASGRDVPYAGSAELRLHDGRVVMQLANPAWRAAQPQEEEGHHKWRRPQVQMMDRADVVRVMDETRLQMGGCCGEEEWCSPLDALPRTRVSHPQSTDETLKKGYRQVAPASINAKTSALGKLYCLGYAVCCISYAIQAVVRPPDVLYKLQELRTGRTVEGVLYSEKGRLNGKGAKGQAHGSGAPDCATQDPTPGGLCSRLRIPDGNTLEFAEGVPLQVRKDMLVVLVYRLTMNSLDPFHFDTGEGPGDP